MDNSGSRYNPPKKQEYKIAARDILMENPTYTKSKMRDLTPRSIDQNTSRTAFNTIDGSVSSPAFRGQKLQKFTSQTPILDRDEWERRSKPKKFEVHEALVESLLPSANYQLVKNCRVNFFSPSPTSHQQSLNSIKGLTTKQKNTLRPKLKERIIPMTDMREKRGYNQPQLFTSSKDYVSPDQLDDGRKTTSHPFMTGLHKMPKLPSPTGSAGHMHRSRISFPQTKTWVKGHNISNMLQFQKLIAIQRPTLTTKTLMQSPFETPSNHIGALITDVLWSLYIYIYIIFRKKKI